MRDINFPLSGWGILAQPGVEGQRELYERLDEVCFTVKRLL